ncbi:hypothetical protein [Tessaracoccus sp.]|nr:hypothetical protein [Tessaracoccus sp.]
MLKSIVFRLIVTLINYYQGLQRRRRQPRRRPGHHPRGGVLVGVV